MGVTHALAKFAAQRVHVLLVEAPDGWRARVEAEHATVALGWHVSLSPADADVLVVCGSAGPELAATVDRIWEQLPGPRVRIQVDRAAEVLPGLEQARRNLSAVDAHADDARTRPRVASVSSASGAHGESPGGASMDHSGMGHGGTDHSQMDHSGMDHSTMDHSGMDHSTMDHSGMDHSTMDHSGMDHSTMDHSGMDHSTMDHSGMDHSTMDHSGMDHSTMDHSGMDHSTMDHSGMDHSTMDHSGMDHSTMDHSGMDHSTMDHSGMDHSTMDHSGMDHSTMDHSGMDHSTMDHSGMDHSTMDHSGMDHSGMDHSGMDHSGMDHSGMDMAPGGIPLADGATDRDGLEMDTLKVQLGPVLPYWPPGLVLHCSLNGDVITRAQARALDDAWEGLSAPGGRDAAARHCDDAAAVLALAGASDLAADARRLRSALLRGDASTAGTALERLERRIRRSLLRWSLGRLGVVDDSALAQHLGLAHAGGVFDRLLGMLGAARDAINGSTEERRDARRLITALPQLVTGLDLAAARLVVASLGLPSLAADRHAHD